MAHTISLRMGPTEWALLLLLALIWGGSFFCFAIALRELPVLTIALLRVGLATLALWAAVLAMGTGLPRSWRVWFAFLVMGLVNNAIPFSLIIWGQKEIAPGLAAVLNATTPFFAVLAAAAFTRDEPMSWNRLAGALTGLGGIAVMIGLDAVQTLGSALTAQMAILLAAVFYAAAVVFGRRFAGLPPLLTAAGQTSGSTLLLLPVALLADRPWSLPMPGLQTWLAIAAIAFLCTSLAYVIYFTILKRAGATNIALVTFLVPVSALLLGVSFLDETLRPQHFLGMLAIGAGLALIDGRILKRQ